MDQEVPGSRPGGGTITFNSLAFTQLGVLHFKPDIEPDRCALNYVHYRYGILELLVHIRHAPVRLRVAANMYGCASGYAAICLLRPLWSAEDATQAGCGVRLDNYLKNSPAPVLSNIPPSYLKLSRPSTMPFHIKCASPSFSAAMAITSSPLPFILKVVG